MKPFFQLKTSQEVYALTEQVAALPTETVDISVALGRTLSGPVRSPEDLPGFSRATMDGYAVRSADTFGAGETSPAYLNIKGEIMMGQAPDFSLAPGECAAIGTGGMLPQGADAVVMVEHTSLLDPDTVEVAKPAAPGMNTLGASEDAARGQELLEEGRRLRPQELGLLAALGLENVDVVRRPKVGIISTGDEVVPINHRPAPGQVRDVNSLTISSLVTEAGGEPVAYGLAKDSVADLTAKVSQSNEECDLTCLSGGSSVGTRDLTVQVFMSFPQAELMVHGVSVSPGKPYIWVRSQNKHLVGLPGQVASCMVAFYLFVDPMLERLHGRAAKPFTRFGRLPATLGRNLPSVSGREEFVRVKLTGDNGRPVAEPVLGKSGLIRTMTRGHGLVKVPLNSEGLYADSPVDVLLFP